MDHEIGKTKILLRDWRWILAVSLLLTIPTYGFTTPMRFAVVAHVIATLLYVGLLVLFGEGFVIEGALVVLILATLVAFCSRPLDRATHRASVQPNFADSVHCTEQPPSVSVSMRWFFRTLDSLPAAASGAGLVS